MGVPEKEGGRMQCVMKKEDKRVRVGPCIYRLFLFRYTNCQFKNEKRTLYPFFVFLFAIRKTKNGYKQTVIVFLIYEQKRKTVQQTVFRFLCIRTKNEMRLQRHSFFVFLTAPYIACRHSDALSITGDRR